MDAIIMMSFFHAVSRIFGLGMHHLKYFRNAHYFSVLNK